MSNGIRALEIILGIIAIIASILVIAYPGLAIGSILFLFGIALLIIGVLRVGSGFLAGAPSSVRTINVVIGILALVIGSVILAFPSFAVGVLVLLLAIGFLFYGLGRIAVGGAAGNLAGWLRGALIILGLIMVAFAVIVIVYPTLGVLTLVFYLSISLLFLGIDSLAIGLTSES